MQTKVTSENPTWVRGNKTRTTEGGNKASSPGMWSPEEDEILQSGIPTKHKRK